MEITTNLKATQQLLAELFHNASYQQALYSLRSTAQGCLRARMHMRRERQPFQMAPKGRSIGKKAVLTKFHSPNLYIAVRLLDNSVRIYKLMWTRIGLRSPLSKVVDLESGSQCLDTCGLLVSLTPVP